MNSILGLKKTSVWLLMIAMLTMSVVAVNAQTIIPINVGENQTGEISTTDTAPSYTLTIASPQTVIVQVLGITQGLAPTFSVFDPSGIAIHTASNDTSQTSVQATLTLLSVGTYRIEVQSAAGIAGQFVISVQAGAAIQPPQPLTVGQVVNGSVNSEAPNQTYAFTGSPTDILRLTISSDTPTSAPVVVLLDAGLSETLGVSSARLAGVQYRIPTGTTNYLVSVTDNGGVNAGAYTLCLESENSVPTCPSSVQGALAPIGAATQTPIPLPPLPSTGPCVVAPASAGSVNVRTGPGTNFAVATQLTFNATAAVVGRLPDNSWYQVNVNGVIGWIAGSVVRLGGQCGTVPAVTPTSVATASGTVTVTATPTATATFTITPTATATATSTTSSGTLDYTLNPNYGTVSLAAGFSPDPYTIGATSGGTVAVSYLGGSCTGYATSAPDFRVTWSGTATLLRIYFVGSGDTTMIVNDPFGNYYCVDDSFGTLNPTIDFNNPSGGTYDIWIGSYTSGASVSGTLSITQSSANHP